MITANAQISGRKVGVILSYILTADAHTAGQSCITTPEGFHNFIVCTQEVGIVLIAKGHIKAIKGFICMLDQER